MMRFFENIGLAFQNLRANPLRSFLILIGMAVGIGAVLHVVVLGELTQQRINERLSRLGSNVLRIRPGFSWRHGVRTGAKAVSLKLSEADALVTQSQVITRTVPVYSGNGDTAFLDKNWSTQVTGTTPAYRAVNNESLVEGRFFNETELKRRARVCVLGATVYEKLFQEGSPIGQTVMIQSRPFEVIGLLEARGESWSNPDDQVFIPLTTAQERIFGVDHLSSILAQMRSAKDYDESLFDIETILRQSHRLSPQTENDFRVRRQDFFLATVQETNKELARFIIVIALVSLVVGGIGIANVMLISVTERTREIGIRRAIGAKKFQILMQFLTESLILGLLGGLLGVGGGVLFNHFYLGEEALLPLVWVSYSFMICAGIGVVAGLYPAFRAANRNVIDSLRYE
ncbi:MAG: ABC transporter permease [Nitrospiria bacterium]